MRKSHVALSVGGFLVAWLFGAISFIDGFRTPEAAAADLREFAQKQAVNPLIEISQERRITVNIANLPLSEVLRSMSERSLFDLKGPLPYGEIVSVTFSDLTLDRALKKLMRGYNYVLLDQGTVKNPLLVIMGRVVRPDPAEQRVPRVVPKRPAPNQPSDSKRYYVPPTITEHQRLPAASGARIAAFADRARKVLEPSAVPPAESRSAGRPPEGTKGAGGSGEEQSAQKTPPAVQENTGVRF